MTQRYVTPAQLAAIAKTAAPFTDQSIIYAIAVACAESGFWVKTASQQVETGWPVGTFVIDTRARNTAGNTPPSTDRGAWEINDHWHPEVTDAMADDPAAAAAAAFRISNGGTDWQPWSTWTEGRAQHFIPDVTKWLQEAPAPMTDTNNNPAPTTDPTDPGFSDAPISADAHRFVCAVANPTGGAWLVWEDGGVWNVGGAPFWGSYPELPAAERQGDGVIVGAYFDAAEHGLVLVRRDVAADGAGLYLFSAASYAALQAATTAA